SHLLAFSLAIPPTTELSPLSLHDALPISAASVVNELANLHSYRGNFAEAGRLYRTALDIDRDALGRDHPQVAMHLHNLAVMMHLDRKSTRLNSSHVKISYAVFCLKKKKQS